jgi:hypothetical protein
MSRLGLWSCVIASLLPCGGQAHDLLVGGKMVNSPLQAAERDNAKLNFLANQARIHSVDQTKVEAARSVYYAAYRWPKTELRICFWNGTQEQQREIMQIADVWHQAVPVMTFNYLDGGNVRVCQVSDLNDFHRMADVRITLAPDTRLLYHPQDLPAKNGDWSYPGRSVAQNSAFPTTMNLVGAMSLKQRSLLSDYYFNVRHEFGHAMSLVHEHQRQICKGWFNIPVIAHDTGWSEAVAKEQVDAIDESSNAYSFIGGYDIESIMQYNFAPSWYMPDRPGKGNPCRRSNQVDDLSDVDKIVVAAMYQPALNETPKRISVIAKAKNDVVVRSLAPKAPSSDASNAALTSASRAPLPQTVSVEAALAEFAGNVNKISSITIQIYPHKLDQTVVLKAIANLGYPIVDSAGNAIRVVSNNTTAMLRGDPTNTILYTPDVPEQDVRYVALALNRAGIELKSIQSYYPHKRNNYAKRNHLIQIGADIKNRGRLALSADDILGDPLPQYGQPTASK